MPVSALSASKAALKLPDPLLVRLWRAGSLATVKRVQIDPQRNITVHFTGPADPQVFICLPDIGWVLSPAT